VPVLLFLNELSCAGRAPRRSVDRAMDQLVELLMTVRAWRGGDIALVSHVPLKTVELAQGYNMQQWISAEAANRDRWRMIRAIQNRAPYRSVTPESRSGDVEYQYAGRRAEGFGAAHLLDGLAISLCLDVAWDRWRIPLRRSSLVEADSGDLVIREEVVEARHAATVDHVANHKSWVQEVGRDGLTSGAAIWASRTSFFPHLTFLPRVEEDLCDLRQDWIQPVIGVLLKLEQTVAEWKPIEASSPIWKTKVTGESETRKSLCEFLDLDGAIRIFELHARFTPGPGRIHFRLIPADGIIRVAYIGRKRGA
jgi:hypothetical protein